MKIAVGFLDLNSPGVAVFLISKGDGGSNALLIYMTIKVTVMQIGIKNNFPRIIGGVRLMPATENVSDMNPMSGPWPWVHEH